jgi:hypothetical protein
MLHGAFMRVLFVAGLALAGYYAHDIRMYAIKTYGTVIHEFDPWFNMRATQYLADNGWHAFFHWCVILQTMPPPSRPPPLLLSEDACCTCCCMLKRRLHLLLLSFFKSISATSLSLAFCYTNKLFINC